jgi:hypothetical protein
MADTINLFDTDAGIVIQAVLIFSDGFDPLYAEVFLDVGFQAPREMELDQIDNDWIATYTIVAGEFPIGFTDARIRLVKNTVVLNSEKFKIYVQTVD